MSRTRKDYNNNNSNNKKNKKIKGKKNTTIEIQNERERERGDDYMIVQQRRHFPHPFVLPESDTESMLMSSNSLRCDDLAPIV